MLLIAAVVHAAEPPVEVEVDGLGVDATSGSPVVRLVEKTAREGAARRELPIWIGFAEAQAIILQMQGLPPPRPLTHDLMTQLVERLGGKLREVVIDDMRDGTYVATIHLDGHGGEPLTVDARPSDAIALALRVRARILVSDALLTAGPSGPLAPAHVWGLTMQDLTPEMGVFFQADGSDGVLVSDVAVGGVAHELTRGDVITALDGTPVHSVHDLQTRIAARPGAEPVRLSVRRQGQDVQVQFSAD